MKITSMFDVLHAKVVRNVVFQKLTDFTRVVLSVGFFAPGMHKLMGIPFTNLPLDNPIGAFFTELPNLPSLAVMLKDQVNLPDTSIEELEQRIEESYTKRLY